MNKEEYIFSLSIYDWQWEVRLLPKDLLTKELGFEARGFTFVDKYTIDISKDQSHKGIMLTFIHELTHAIICTQGRAFQNKFSQEDVCNFVAWASPCIGEAVKKFSQWLGANMFGEAIYE